MRHQSQAWSEAWLIAPRWFGRSPTPWMNPVALRPPCSKISAISGLRCRPGSQFGRFKRELGRQGESHIARGVSELTSQYVAFRPRRGILDACVYTSLLLSPLLEWHSNLVLWTWLALVGLPAPSQVGPPFCGSRDQLIYTTSSDTSSRTCTQWIHSKMPWRAHLM